MLIDQLVRRLSCLSSASLTAESCDVCEGISPPQRISHDPSVISSQLDGPASGLSTSLAVQECKLLILPRPLSVIPIIAVRCACGGQTARGSGEATQLYDTLYRPFFGKLRQVVINITVPSSYHPEIFSLVVLLLYQTFSEEIFEGAQVEFSLEHHF